MNRTCDALYRRVPRTKSKLIFVLAAIILAVPASAFSADVDTKQHRNLSGKGSSDNGKGGRSGADLSITKSDSPDPATVGSELKYSISVKNAGPSGASGVTVTDTLPTGVEFRSASSSQGSCSQSGSTVTCNLGNLAKRAAATLNILVSPKEAGNITNTAMVQADQSDPKSSNNMASATTTVNAAEPIQSEVVIAVIDTGARASHQEFTYLGPSSNTDQFVAWWDFTDEVKGEIVEPLPGQLWETHPMARDPYDRHGHGTSTASMAAGRNMSTAKDPSFCPGCKLAIAKVGNEDGSIPGDIAAAIRWAVDTVGADVISISIGSIIPAPNAFDGDVHEAARYARRAGTLVTVSNGNGVLQPGAGQVAWATPFADSTEVLAVGGAGPLSLLIASDPEVTAKFLSVGMASRDCDTCYERASGTSFSNPTVAGMAAGLMREAIANGKPSSPEYIETLLKFSARDTELPPTFEGYGVLDAAQMNNLGIPHARAGTLPSRPSPDVNSIYVENVAGSLRDAWSNKLDAGLKHYVATGIKSGNGPGMIGPSTQGGLSDSETYTVTLSPGQLISVSLEYVPPINGDIELYVFSGTGPSFNGDQLVTRSVNTIEESEFVSFRNYGTLPATYSIVVLGFLVFDDQKFDLTSSIGLTMIGDGYLLTTQ